MTGQQAEPAGASASGGCNGAVSFAAGRNIAMKLPIGRYRDTVAFYRDVLGLPVEVRSETTAVVSFGPMRLWLDRVAELEQAELWLEVETDDVAAAAARLAAAGIEQVPPAETLPEGFEGFWVRNPAGLIHLVAAIGG